MANDTKYGFLISPAPQFLDTNGKPISGGKLKVYIAGTTTKATTYSDWNLTKNTWPIVLDSMGTCQAIVSSANLYKFVLEGAEGEEPLITRDNVAVAYANVDITGIGSEVVNSDGSVDVTATTDPDTGRTTYDVSVKDTVQDLEGLIEDETDRATAAEKAAKTEIVAGDNITVTKTVGADGQDVYTIDGEGEDNLVDDVRVNGTSVVTDKVANIDVPVAGTASPLMDGAASAGASGKFAREDHVHPSDTSREAVANKTAVVLGTSDSKYPTDKAVANFVNSSIATKKDKQTAVTFTGSTLKTPTSMTQDANGELAVTFSDIQSASTSQKGVVQLSDSTASASSETAATSAAVKQAYDLAASKQDAVSTDTDSSDFSDDTTIATGFGSNKIHLNVASRLWNYIKGKLGISSSGSSTKFLNEQGEWATVTTTDVSNKLDKDGLGDDVRVQFTQATTRTNIVTTSKLSVLFGNIQKWFADLKALAFKDKVGTGDVESGTYPIDISGNATTATSATTASATSSGSIQSGDDLNSYNVANRTYQCSAAKATTVTNKPAGASGAFELEVIRGTGSTCVQIYYSRDDVNFNYIRKCTGINDGTWTGWVKFIDSDDTVAKATTANKLGSANVGLPYMPIYLYGGTPMSIEGYFCRPSEDPSTRNLSAETTLNAVGGGKYVYNVSTSNTFSLTLASTASGSIAFVVRLKCKANCPYVNVTYNDAVEKTTLTRHVYLSSGKMVDMCFTYYYGYFHLVSLVEGDYS